jgi:coenzyme F420-reducing hydrogenase delta subunit
LTTYVFYCSNGFDAPQLRTAGRAGGADVLKTVGLPCSGKVDIPYLMKAFENGADGVAIVTCKRDECRNVEGSLRACKRAEAVQALLEEIGEPAHRVTAIESGEQGADGVLADIARFTEGLKDHA